MYRDEQEGDKQEKGNEFAESMLKQACTQCKWLTFCSTYSLALTLIHTTGVPTIAPSVLNSLSLDLVAYTCIFIADVHPVAEASVHSIADSDVAELIVEDEITD